MNATRCGWVGLVALVPLQGCVTERLWEDWPDRDPGHTYMPARQAAPQEVLEAVRAGDGSHHLLVRMSDGMNNRYVIDGAARAPEGDLATIDSRHWPGMTDAIPVPQLGGYATPPGLPLAVAGPGAPEAYARPQTPDAAMAVLVDALPEPTADDPVVGLDGRKVVVTDSEGQVTVLGEFPPPPVTRPAPPPRQRGHVARVANTGARVVMTPFAVALDVALGAGIVAGCALLLPFAFFTAPMLFR